MKIVCLIKPSPPTIYFVNEIHRHHPVELVVRESSKPSGPRKSKMNRLLDSMKTYGVLTTLHSLLDRPSSSDRQQCHNQFFGDQWTKINPEIPVLDTDNINSREVEETLSTMRPDLLLDHGTSIVKANILDTAPLALNLHWGLSPYYRGVNCTEWALLHWDPLNIGVTIHKLSAKIDGGEILAQHRASVQASDDAYSINMQLTKLGTDVTTSAIGQLNSGQELRFHPQDPTRGYLTLTRQSSRHLGSHMRHIERHGVPCEDAKDPASQAIAHH